MIILALTFFVLMFMIFGKLLKFALKAAWHIAVIVGVIGFLPIILTIMMFAGLIFIAIPILAIVGLVTILITALG